MVRRMRRVSLIFGRVVLAVLGLALVIPLAFHAVRGGFRWRPIYEAVSPDGNMRLVFKTRVAYPPHTFRLNDPAVVLRVALEHTAGGHVEGFGWTALHRQSHFSEPSINWGSSEVLVTRFDADAPQQIRFNIGNRALQSE